MEEILKRIKEAEDGLGGWIEWQYTDGSDSYTIGYFDVNKCTYNYNLKRFLYRKKRHNGMDSLLLLTLDKFSNIERYFQEEVNGVMRYCFCCMLPGDTMGTSKKNIDVDVFVVLKPYNIKTFFRMIKNKLKRK